jgi:hypothetical protein
LQIQELDTKNQTEAFLIEQNKDDDETVLVFDIKTDALLSYNVLTGLLSSRFQTMSLQPSMLAF